MLICMLYDVESEVKCVLKLEEGEQKKEKATCFINFSPPACRIKVESEAIKLRISVIIWSTRYIESLHQSPFDEWRMALLRLIYVGLDSNQGYATEFTSGFDIRYILG